MMTGGRKRATLRLALGVIAFFAVLPSVVPCDHLFLHESIADEAHNAVHEAHCHLTPGSCADAPLPAGPGQLLFSEPLVVMPLMIELLIVILLPAWAGISREPDVPPPLG